MNVEVLQRSANGLHSISVVCYTQQIKPTLAVIKGVEDYIQGSIDENYEIDCRLIVTLAVTISRQSIS